MNKKKNNSESSSLQNISSLFWRRIINLQKRGIFFKVFLLWLWMGVLSLIVYLISPSSWSNIWLFSLIFIIMLLMILVPSWITGDFDMSFGKLIRAWASFMIVALILGFISSLDKESIGEILWYLLIALYFLKWPLIILAILWWLYWLVRFIKWAWKH